MRWPDKQEQKRIFSSVFGDAKPDHFFFTMVVLSCVVATYGLLLNSIAVVIGAMLIAPLMGPILGGALAIATNNNELLKVSVKTEALGTIIAIAIAAMLTLVLPHAELTPEVIARTTPTILDLLIALASGAAGTYAICVKPQGAVLPGVAIATALMPPLCVIGIGLAKQDFGVVTGALLLFLSNTIAINVAAILTFSLAGFSLDACSTDGEENCNQSKHRLLYPVVLLVLISVPLAFIMYKTYNQANTEKTIRSSLTESLDVIAPRSTLISFDYKEAGIQLQVNAAFRTTKIMGPENIRQMENLLELRLGKPARINADVVLVQKANDKTTSDPFLELLPKVKEKQIVEVVKTSTPEEIIDSVVREKLTLLPGVKLEDFSLDYRNSSGRYTVTIILSGATALDDKFGTAIQGVLEDRLNRRVEVIIQLPPAAVPIVKPSDRTQ